MTSLHQPVTEDLRRWIVAQAEAGCRPDDVLAAMRASGWTVNVATAALEQTLLDHLAAKGGALPVPAPAVALPLPVLALPGQAMLAGATRLQAGGRAVDVLTTLQRARRPVQLQSFASDGYAFDEAGSAPDRLVFRRRQ